MSHDDVLGEFLAPHFGAGFTPKKLKPGERVLLENVLEFVSERFADAKYVLGLAIDFAILAQRLAADDAEAKDFRPTLTKKTLFVRYTLVTSRGKRQANTLTLKFDGRSHGIRKTEEAVIDLFVELARPGYPSAYVYNTGQWQKFQDSLLVPCFQLSESARFLLCTKLVEFGLANLTAATPTGRPVRRIRLFEEILRNYPRSDAGENAGAVFQGIVSGFIKADRPHLSLIVDKTRTGSARQSRIGDVDGYVGLDLELSVEVKDHALTSTNVARQVGEFLGKVKRNRVLGLVFCQSAEPDVVEAIRAAGAGVMTVAQMQYAIGTWDWHKQNAGVNGVLHYLSHVEQNPDAVSRLLRFIKTADPTHDSLVFYASDVEGS